MNAYDCFAAAAGHPITELEARGVDAALDPNDQFDRACARYMEATGRRFMQGEEVRGLAAVLGVKLGEPVPVEVPGLDLPDPNMFVVETRMERIFRHE